MSANLRTYGRYDTPENPTKCIESVWGGWTGHQCHRKRGHGPDGLYCRQHDPDAKAAKQAAEEAERKKAHKALVARSAALAVVVRRLGVGTAAWDGSAVTLTPSEAEALAKRLRL